MAFYLVGLGAGTRLGMYWRNRLPSVTPAFLGDWTRLKNERQLVCETSGHSHWQYHSCRNGHCPSCCARAKDA